MIAIATFNKLHSSGLFRNINKGQVQGIEAIINECQLQGVTDPREIAYILATVYHEVNKTMQPIEEYGRGAGKPYGLKLKYGKGPNKREEYSLPNKIYYGRGLTQNTWYEIYEKLSKTQKAKAEGWDFLNKPELLLSLTPSVWATVYAMRTGLYTGRKLSQYFNTKTDWVGARAIINGQDKAKLIAGYAQKFLNCIS